MEVQNADILPEKCWYALGRISKFLKSNYPFPDVRSGAYGYEPDSEIITDLFLDDLEELSNYLKGNPLLNDRDRQRLKDTYTLLNLEDKCITPNQSVFLIYLNSVVKRI